MKQRVLSVFAVTIMAAGLLPAVATATNTGDMQTYIVLYQTTPSPEGNGTAIARAGGTIVADYRAIGVVVARSSNPSFGTAIRATYGVEGAASTAGFATRIDDDQLTADEAAALVTTPVTDSSEPLFGLQWDMVQINTPDAHAITGGSSSVTVADLDTGLDFTHPDLAPNYDAANSTDCSSGTPTALGVGNDQNGHGTHTAGTIAAAANGIGIVGTAPGVKVAGVKSSNDAGFFFPEMVICSYMWVATHPAIKVTNNSYFADPWLFNCATDATQRAIWKAEQRAMSYAQSKGVTIVASMGNFDDDLAHPTQDTQSPDNATPVTRDISNACRVVPNEIPGVVGVSATGPSGDKARYSNYGFGVTDVAAPGGDSRCDANGCLFTRRLTSSNVLSTYPSYLYGGCGAAGVTDQGATYCYLAGTSMASPHAAGVAALILSTHPKATASKVASLLGSTANPTACPTDASLLEYYSHYVSTNNGAPSVCTGGTTSNSWYGQGTIDAYNAITH